MTNESENMCVAPAAVSEVMLIIVGRSDLRAFVPCRTVWCAVITARSPPWWETLAWQRRSQITGQLGNTGSPPLLLQS